jgi:hypothetical protein
LAEERAQAEIIDQFTKLKDDALFPFFESYAQTVEEIEEAKKQGTKPKTELPTSNDLKELAERERLGYEVTRLLAREQEDQFGQIARAEVGIAKPNGGRKFAEEFFDPKKPLYEPEELTDLLGTRYLARKIKDVPAHVPSLDEVRSDVSLAWKMSKARTLAENAAQLLAEQLKKKGDILKDSTVDGYRVVTIPAIARRQSNFLPSRFETGPPEDSPIPDVTYPGELFRNTYFGLQPGSAAVAPNQPRTVYYVMVPERREPATFASLYAPNGDEFRYKMSARQEAGRQLEDQWMGWLRQQAGLDTTWVAPDESRGKSSVDDA